MKIAIDASNAAREEGTGVAVYIGELARALAKIAPLDRFVLYYRASRIRARRLFLERPGPNFDTAFPPLSLVRARKIDVGHGPDGRLFKLGRSSVVTLHDVFSLISADWADEKFRNKKKDRYEQIAKKAGLIICDSQSTADDFASLFPGAKGRLRVVPLGVGPEFHPAPGTGESASPYILHVGNIASRKNLARLVGAFEALAGPHPELRLVLAGRLSYRHEEVLEKIAASEYRDRIDLPGYVPRSELPALYRGARALVFPSLYEGFGLPALEAMACGTPVVASNRSSLPEVVGKAGLLVNPEKEDEIAGAVGSLLSDESLWKRLSQAGPRRAGEFPWKQTAIKTIEVYREACGPPARRAGEQENS